MFSKYKLQHMGFDYIDKHRNYVDTLRKVTQPKGPSNFRQAYAYGVGMMLNYAVQYIEEADLFDENFKKPEFLHIVLCGEEDAADSNIIPQDDITGLQQTMIEVMNTELKLRLQTELDTQR